MDRDWLAGTPAVRRVTVDPDTGLVAVTFAESDGSESVALLDEDEVRAVAERLGELTEELRITGRPRRTLKEAVADVLGRDPWQ